MKSSNLFAALSIVSLPSLSAAVPLTRNNGPSEHDVLNFALTLEFLETEFYKEGLQKYSSQDFINAGFPSAAFGRYQEILEHESTHVTFLSNILGSEATKQCQYSFPYSDVTGFVELSDMLETVGASAYTGAAHLLSTPDLITGAAAILSTEARQSTWISSTVRHLNPWNTEFETPLDINQVFTIASGLIVSCPSGNPIVGTAFPSITIEGTQTPGSTISIKFTATSQYDHYFATFLNGLETISIEITEDNGCFSVEIPSHLLGVTFLVITSDGSKSDDSVTIAGPFVMNFPFDENEHIIY